MNLQSDITAGDMVLVNWEKFRPDLYNYWSFSQIIRYDELMEADCDFIVIAIGIDDHERLVKARVNPAAAKHIDGCGALGFIFPLDVLHKIYDRT